MDPLRTVAGFTTRHVLLSANQLNRTTMTLNSMLQSRRLIWCHRNLYATKAMHEKAYRRTRFAPRAVYQPTTPVTWIISEGSVSADKESIALAEALGLPWAIKRVKWRQGLQWIPTPFKKLLMDYHHVVNRKSTDKLPWFMEGDALAAPYPSFVIGSGAKAFPGLLHVSRMSGKASFSAHIHFPALPFVHFDQVFLQRHEIVVQLAGLGLMKDQKNYFRINSTLNTITQRSLDVAKRKAFELELIPKSFFNQGNRNGLTRQPIVTILIGGPNEDCSHNTERLISRLSRLLDVQGSRVLLSFSQRTADNTKVAVKKLESHIQDENRLYVYDPVADVRVQDTIGFINDHNPYEAMLALADKIVVTADSVAMTNEALATGKPVYILGGELARGKLKVFHRYLADHNATRTFRPGRVPVLSGNEPNIVSNITTNDTADPLSYPGDHPPWNHKLLADQGTEEVKRLAQRLKIIRDCRISGRRIPEEIANSTC
ncbi:hypothetical protein BX616_005715 [Lobosporangium transversale]|nr:hypothetical protein BX616_005715 [Lobosporangium transversale]